MNIPTETNRCLPLRDRLDIVTLPENMYVDGFLDLSGCHNLRELPNGLTVNGHLFLIDCINLKSIPKDLNINGYIHISNCPGIKNIPKTINATGGFVLDGIGFWWSATEADKALQKSHEKRPTRKIQHTKKIESNDYEI